MHRFFTIIALLSCFFTNAQTGFFVDPRDQQSYQTIVIGNKTWLRENLRFQTRNSFCPNFNKDPADCKNGNYYSNSELHSICPEGWHVSTIPEWEDFVRQVVKQRGLDPSLFKYDSLKSLQKAYAMNIKQLDLFNDTTLHILPIGWVEGFKLRKNESATLWLVDTETNDDKYHIHMAKWGFIKHSHDHNIIDKPSKIRKFPVRCVCELKKEPG